MGFLSSPPGMAACRGAPKKANPPDIMQRHRIVISSGALAVLVAAMGASVVLIGDGLLRIRAATIT